MFSSNSITGVILWTTGELPFLSADRPGYLRDEASLHRQQVTGAVPAGKVISHGSIYITVGLKGDFRGVILSGEVSQAGPAEPRSIPADELSGLHI